MNANENDLISVIVPAYNVERFVFQCLSSISNQTYRILEIICVDDGSIDGTFGQIERAARLDNRIKIFKKENTGVSDTRNYGLERATGKYIVFVDADDYLDALFVEHLYGAMINSDANFSFYSLCFRHKKDRQPKKNISKKNTSEETLVALLSPNVVVGCWNKLYKRDLLERNSIWFKKDLFYGEGLQFITAYAQVCYSSIKLVERRYYYRKNNECSATSAFNLNKYVNGEKSLKFIYENLQIKTKLVEDAYQFHLCMFYLTSFLDILKNKCKKEYFNLYKSWRKKFLHLSKNALLYKKVSLFRRMIVLAGVICPYTLAFLDRKRKQNEARKSF